MEEAKDLLTTDEMEILQTEGSTSLYSKLAPFLIFDHGDNTNSDYDEEEEEEEDTHNTEEDTDEDSEEELDITFYSIPKKQLLTISTCEMLKNSAYWVTPQGWLFVINHDSQGTFLWTPLTQQKVELPPAEDGILALHEWSNKCLLSKKPTDPNCVVLLMDSRNTIFWYCQPGGSQWFKHDYSHLFQHDHNDIMRDTNDIAAVQGKFYIASPYSIVTAEFFPNPTFTITTIEIVNWLERYSYSNSRIMESDGELFNVYFFYSTPFSFKTVHIAVYKMDFGKKTWVKIDRLGDRVFFMQYHEFGSSWSASHLNLKEGCIYFLQWKDKALYVFDMERGTIRMQNPGIDLPDSCTPSFLMPVMP